MHAQPLSTSASLAGRENRSGVILGSQEVNALLRRTVQFQPLLPFDRDRPGPRQPLNLRCPLDGKPTVTDLAGDPIAADTDSGAPSLAPPGRSSKGAAGEHQQNFRPHVRGLSLPTTPMPRTSEPVNCEKDPPGPPPENPPFSDFADANSRGIHLHVSPTRGMN